MYLVRKVKKCFCGLNPSLYGDYCDYDEAEKRSGTYDDEAIVHKVLEATQLVISGIKAYERDGVCFEHLEINYNLLYYFEKIYIQDGELNVCDFGGALGSTYWQHKKSFFDEIQVSWNIVEQGKFVDCGKKYIKDEHLKFYFNVNEINTNINCVLFSSVLQYFENFNFIKIIINYLHPEYIIFERTPVSIRKRILIEDVSEPIYNSKRPYVCNKEEELVGFIQGNGYDLIDSWDSLVDPKIRLGKQLIELKSFVFKKCDFTMLTS